jgi:hypothetical protein
MSKFVIVLLRTGYVFTHTVMTLSCVISYICFAPRTVVLITLWYLRSIRCKRYTAVARPLELGRHLRSFEPGEKSYTSSLYPGVVHVDGVRVSMNCGRQKGLFFLSQVIYEYGEPRWNDIDRGTEELEKYLYEVLVTVLCTTQVK